VSLLLKDAEQSDDALMIRAQAGDTNAFGLLYDRHAARGLRVARAICRDLGRAEDVVQESFLAIWRSRASYRPETGSFQAWAMTIVKNRALDSLRSAAARPQTQDGVTAEDPAPGADSKSDSPQDEVLARSERDALLASLRQLPEAQAEVIVLAFYGELSHSEIAAELDLPAGTIKGRMRLGLEKLRREMHSDPRGQV
jgi:RNA polymerase sigma-70 factor (ECF subfamily)